MKEFQTEFIVKKEEVSEEKYYEMLGCLPPIRLVNNAFMVGEAVDGTEEGLRYDVYFSENGKYYFAGAATLKDFDLWVVERPGPEKRACLRCGDELSFSDDLICGYHQLED